MLLVKSFTRISFFLAVSVFSTFPVLRADPFKVMSYNIQGGNALNDGKHCNKIAQVIYDSGADIIALQEVHNNWYSGNDWGNLSLSGDKHTEKIKNRLNALSASTWYENYAQTWTKLSIRGTGHGIGIISRWEFDVLGVVNLETSGANAEEPRRAIIAYVWGAPNPFYFICTHFIHEHTAGCNKTRAGNVKAITKSIDAWLGDEKRNAAPVILAGDLNSPYDGNIAKKIAGTANSDGIHALAQLRHMNWEITNDSNPSGTYGPRIIFDYIATYKNAPRLLTLKHYSIAESNSDHDPAISILMAEGETIPFSGALSADNVANTSTSATLSISTKRHVDWSISTNAPWCVPVKQRGNDSSTISFAISRNTSNKTRIATITLTETFTNQVRTFTITQAAGGN